MPSDTNDFFEGKRPWSKMKDRILGSYLVPYLAKVNRLGRKIILIDAFAGPGLFEDHTPGSPLLISNAAKKYVQGDYEAWFINNDKNHHNKLDNLLKDKGFYPHSQALFGDSREILRDCL